MRSSKLSPLIFIVLFFFSSTTKGQLYKQWGQWLSDTTLSQQNVNAPIYGMALDSANNIFLLSQNLAQGRNTVSVLSLDKNGQSRWQKDYSNNNPGQNNYYMDCDIYKWGEKIITLVPHYSDSSKYYYVFNHIDQNNGAVLKSWTFEIPAIEINSSANKIISSDGNIFFTISGNNSRAPGVAKFDLNNNAFRYQILPPKNDAYTLNISPIICDINDSLIAFSNQTDTNNRVSGFECDFIRKKDLSVFSQYHESYNLSANTMIADRLGLYLFGYFGYRHLNIQSQQLHASNAVSARKAAKDVNGNLYYVPDGTNIIVNQIDGQANEQWKYDEANPNFTINQSVNDITSTSKNITVNAYRSFYNFGGPGPALPQNLGIKTNVISFDGTLESDFVQDFDSTRGRLNQYTSALDNEGNPIILAEYYFYEKPQLGITSAHYLYKLCNDCDTNTPPITKLPYENYITISGNPVNKMLSYWFGIVTPYRLAFFIHDTNGKQLYCDYYKQHPRGEFNNMIDLEKLSLTPGSYILSMQTTYNSYAQKFIYNP